MKRQEKNIIGKRVAKTRKERQLTQLDLSTLLNKAGVDLDRAGVAKIELGLRGVYDYELAGFSKTLNVSAKWLLTGRK